MHLINTETLQLEEFDDKRPPAYAILSHTWGLDFEELTFSDVKNGTVDKSGKGWTKFLECCKQAKKDSLGYAWIDTCCIDKTSLVELGEAINSMFRWYSLASVCYVYLSDVPDDDDPSVIGSKFRKSRWFRRGWTLQELLAPKHLRFYNSEWHYIGTKGSRCTVIQEITQIPRQFLLGVSELHAASVAQRMSWAAQRETKRAEDLAYCLLGIFGIAMPMIYGEGGKEAFFRLQEQIMKTTRDDSILAWGLNTEPSIRSPQKFTDGDMFVYGDILAATPSDFVNSGQIIARAQATNPLHSLDIFGGSLRVYLPLLTTDTGETLGLLSCGPKSDTQQVVAIPLAKISSAAANEYVRPKGSSSALRPIPTSEVLPELIHIQKDGQRKISTKNHQHLFYDEDLFAKVGLRVIEVVPRACWDDQLALISQKSNLDGSINDQVLIRARHSKWQSLDFVIMIDFHQPKYLIDLLYCVFTCHRRTGLEDIAGKFERATLEAFRQKSASNGPFHLRIDLEPMAGNITSIVPKGMTHPPEYTLNATMALKNLGIVLESTRLLLEKKQNDAKIKGLSQRVEDNNSFLEHIEEKRETIESEYKRLEAEKRILVAERVVAIQEKVRIEKEQEMISERQNAIYEQVVHEQKRLKEFYYTQGCQDGWTPFRSAVEIGDIDMMDLLFDETTDVMVEDKLLMPWIIASRNGDADAIKLLLDTGRPELDRKDGIFGRTPLSWASMNGHRDVVKLLLDTKRVDIRSKDNYGRTPVRWASDRGYYNIVQLMLQKDKPVYLRKFRGHDKAVYSVAFSHDSKLLVSGSHDKTVKLWDSTTGACIHTFRGHGSTVYSVALSHDSKLVASVSSDDTVKLWNSATGELVHTLRGHGSTVHSVAFSHDSKFVASGSSDATVKLWDSTTGELIHTLRDHSNTIHSVAFSHDSRLVASGSSDCTVKLWDRTTGELIDTLRGHSNTVRLVAFSHDSRLVASGSLDGTVKLWDSITGECEHTLYRRYIAVMVMALSPDLNLAAAGLSGQGLNLWDVKTGEFKQNSRDLENVHLIHSAAFSHDSKLIASGSSSNDIVLCDVSTMHDVVASSEYHRFAVERNILSEY
ncbi:hypothetical protein ACSS6W_005746 [Trichoderma asperelloides]